MSMTFLRRPLSTHCQQPHYIWFYSIRPSLVVRMLPHWSRILWIQVQTHQNWNSFFYYSSSSSCFVCVRAHACMHVCIHMCVMGSAYTHICTCGGQRFNVSLYCFPPLFFEVRTFSETGACSSGQTGWTSSPQSSAPPSPSLKPQHSCGDLRTDMRPLWSYPLCQLLRTSQFFLSSGVCIVPGMLGNPHLSPFLFLKWIEYL